MSWLIYGFLVFFKNDFGCSFERDVNTHSGTVSPTTVNNRTVRHLAIHSGSHSVFRSLCLVSNQLIMQICKCWTGVVRFLIETDSDDEMGVCITVFNHLFLFYCCGCSGCSTCEGDTSPSITVIFYLRPPLVCWLLFFYFYLGVFSVRLFPFRMCRSWSTCSHPSSKRKMKALSCLARGRLTFIFFFSASKTVEHTKRVIRVVAGACQFFTRAGCSSNLLPSPYMTFSKTSGSFLARVLSVNFFLLTHIECPCQPP